MVRLLIANLICFCTVLEAAAVEHITLRRDGQEQQIEGKLIVAAEDGGLLVMAADGQLWAIRPGEIVAHTKDAVVFKPLTRKQLAARLLKELPPGFKVHTTAHYIICYNTSRSYAEWCGALYERLYRVFRNYWSNRGFELHVPETPLVAIVFADRGEYRQHAIDELGAASGSVIGYYSLRSNRITMYDLTGVSAAGGQANRRGSTSEINQVLAQPAALPLVATIIHEATHQIAYNCGLQTRYADIPLWISEGIAVYFETPDLKSSKGWRSIDGVNPSRLATFRDGLATRADDALGTLIMDDRRLRDGRGAVDAYAEAWALNFFLIRQHRKEYSAYLKMLSEKPQFVWDDPQTRLAEFKQYFGDNLEKLEADFLRHLSKVK